MSMRGSSTKRLQPTGALHEDSLYIERASDQDLFDALLAGEFCSVLAPRQIGKSSLRVRTARRLTSQGVRCAQVDLTTLGRAADSAPIATWYFSLASRIADELHLDEPSQFFEQHDGLLAADRFGMYLRRQVLRAQSGPVVIFLDEIDYIRALPIDRDEFFVAIRALYNERAQVPDLRRLTFCLLGVAAPKDLVVKPEITPFNIGKVIHLVDFSRAEIEPFAEVVQPLGQDPQQWLDEVYRWTAGHPYMTQTLCAKLLNQSFQQRLGTTEAESAALAALSVFVYRGRSEDSNLGYAEKRLDESPLKAELLSLYRQLLDQEPIRYDEGDPVQQELQLCGMAAPVAGNLQVRNRIFAQVFDRAWLAEKQTLSILGQAMQQWQRSGRSSAALLRGIPLSRVRQWAREHPRDIAVDEREFLNICFDALQQESEQRELGPPARGGSWLRGVVATGAVMLGVFAALSWSVRAADPKTVPSAASVEARSAASAAEKAASGSSSDGGVQPAALSIHAQTPPLRQESGSPQEKIMPIPRPAQHMIRLAPPVRCTAIRLVGVHPESSAGQHILSCARTVFREGLQCQLERTVRLQRTGQLYVISQLPAAKSLQMESCLAGLPTSETPQRVLLTFSPR